MRRAWLILNPIPWERRVKDGLAPLMSTLEAGGIRCELSFTKMTHTMTKTVAAAVREGYDLVVAGGGDGTVSEVASALVGTGIPLGIIPCGTFNNIASSLGIAENLGEAAALIVAGKTRDIDTGLANRDYFFEASGVGLDASLFPIGEEIKGGRYHRVFQAARRFLGYSVVEMRITLDGGTEIRANSPLVVVANGPYYGSAFNIAPEAQLDDGVFSVVVFETCTRFDVAGYLAATAQRRQSSLPCISTYKASSVEVSAEASIPAHADGKPIGTTPVTFRTIPKGLRVIVP